MIDREAKIVHISNIIVGYSHKQFSASSTLQRIQQVLDAIEPVVGWVVIKQAEKMFVCKQSTNCHRVLGDGYRTRAEARQALKDFKEAWKNMAARD